MIVRHGMPTKRRTALLHDEASDPMEDGMRREPWMSQAGYESGVRAEHLNAPILRSRRALAAATEQRWDDALTSAISATLVVGACLAVLYALASMTGLDARCSGAACELVAALMPS